MCLRPNSPSKKNKTKGCFFLTATLRYSFCLFDCFLSAGCKFHFHFFFLLSSFRNGNADLADVCPGPVFKNEKWKTIAAIASSSVATEWVKGKTLDECLEVKNTDIAAHLKLPPVKLHCSMLAEDAIKAAVKDLKSKM